LDSQLKSKRAIFLLDTCHSAGLSGKKVVGLEKPAVGGRSISSGDLGKRQLTQVEVKNDVSQAATRLFSSPGRAIFTSSGEGEASLEATRWGGGHGVFTWALLEGLNGKADADGNRVITAEELFNFVRERVRVETNSKQNPQIFSNLANGLEIAVLK
ncbi:MAG: caspase family protein, partial [Pyrinomonadaceae bacterium]